MSAFLEKSNRSQSTWNPFTRLRVFPNLALKSVARCCFVRRDSPRPLAIKGWGLLWPNGAKERIEQDEVVRLFAGRLKEVRRSRGLTQMELSRQAQVTASYIWRLESGGAAPGIDLVARLAHALGTTTHDLLPATRAAGHFCNAPRSGPGVFNAPLAAADRETLLMLNPLLARLVEASERSR